MNQGQGKKVHDRYYFPTQDGSKQSQIGGWKKKANNQGNNREGGAAHIPVNRVHNMYRQ